MSITPSGIPPSYPTRFSALRAGRHPLSVVAIAISAAMLALTPAGVFAQNGTAGASADATHGGGGGGGGSVDAATGNGGDGGTGGLGGSGQGSSGGGDGAQGSVDGVASTRGGQAGSGGVGNNGTPGATNGSGAGGGGGGAGAVGVILSGSGSNSGSIVGGQGGSGGNGGQNNSNNPTAGDGGNGGGGGDGGSGVLVNITASYDNNGTVRGGNGGSGGNTGSAAAATATPAGTELLGGSGGKGGQGGDGITAVGGGTITNGAQGVIAGGDGATGGLAADSNAMTNASVNAVGGTGGLGNRGGSGVFLSGVSTITNAGSIRGGNGGNGNNGGAARGTGNVVAGNGADAGDGGTGAWVSGSGTINNLAGGSIVGGNGGTGGGGSSLSSGATIAGGIGGAGGEGGSGVKLTAGGQVDNAGAITGGLGNRGGGSGNATDGGLGGDSGRGGTGIEIISSGNVTNESSGIVTGGNGGDDSAGGGGLGGVGGSGVSITGGGNVVNYGDFTGGNGGAGANGVGAAADGGMGAEGGNGLEVQGAGSVLNAAGASINGGSGGTGGGAGGNNGAGGAGGAGGSGVLVAAGGSVTNAGTITGGTGNRGGGGGGADGGAGGTGVEMITGGGTVMNSGTISGGQGGTAGTAGSVLGAGDAGAGGVGVYGSDMTIVNSGTLSGGLAQDGVTRADAVQFTAGTNSLELWNGYVVTGTVNAATGDNTLILGGDADSSFDASLIGPAAQYRGFSAYHKTGAGTWLLNASTAAVTPWTLYDGILQVSQDGSLGDPGGSLTFDGGTLRLGSQFDLAATRSITLDNGGGTLDTQGYNTTIAQGISGSGGLTKLGAGRLTLTGDSAYSGLTTVAGGNVDVTGSLAGAVDALSGTVLTGTGSVGGVTLENGGRLSVGSTTYPDNGAAAFSINGDLTNNGIIDLGHNGQAAGSTLSVSGDYAGGAGSVLNMNTVLGGDDSLTDRLSIQGSTAGSTAVAVRNAGGVGARTPNGIEIISVGGNSAAGAFYKQGRIVAGQYDYSLMQKGKNWYLTSMYTGPVIDAPQPPVTPPPVTPPVTPPVVPPVTPVSPENPRYTLRPEAGAYAANLAAANTLFTLALDDREGATEYRAPLDGQPYAGSLWLRQEGGHNAFRMGDGQLQSSSNRYVAQLGNEFLHGSVNGDDRWGAGLMAGYGDVSGSTRSSLTGYRAKSRMDGYSAGAYGTWYQDAVNRTGAYLDSWLLYNWFNNSVAGDDLPQENYKSRGFTASLETGYAWRISASSRGGVYLEPQAQLIWMGVKSPDHQEENGTRIQSTGQDNLQSRLGLRLYLRGHSAVDEGKDRTFKPYVEADWIHNTHQFGVRMNQDSLTQEGTANVGQIKLGVQGQLTPALNVWGGTAVQVGDSGYYDASAQLGIKYRF